jgi:hypothetical protein
MITETEFRQFADIISGQVHSLNDPDRIRITTGNSKDTETTITYTLEDPWKITLEMDDFTGGTVSCSAPVHEWNLTQDIDNGQLLTELSHESGLSFWIHGPRAKYKENNQIKLLEHENEDFLLID